jgi:putative oxidoreductase
MSQTAIHSRHAALHHDQQAAAMAVALMEEAQLKEAKLRRSRSNRAFVAGRLMLAAVFIIGAVAKAATFRATSAAMEDYGLQLTDLLLTVAIGVELTAGALLAIGYKVRQATVVLSTWLVAVTVVMHGNLSVDTNRSAALLNLAVVGGLLLLFAHGAGDASVDKALAQKAAREA